MGLDPGARTGSPPCERRMREASLFMSESEYRMYGASVPGIESHPSDRTATH